jgi:hypothetical protein
MLNTQNVSLNIKKNFYKTMIYVERSSTEISKMFEEVLFLLKKQFKKLGSL